MFGKVKRILGIEGVKIELTAPLEVRLTDDIIKGSIKLSTLSNQTITKIELKLIEKYARGNKENRLIDEYTIGELTLDDRVEISKDETIELNYELPFKVISSEMDMISSKGILRKGLVGLAKKLRKVSSTYRIVADATVAGTRLQPSSEKEIIIL